MDQRNNHTRSYPLNRLIYLLFVGSIISFLVVIVAALGFWSFTRPAQVAPAPQSSFAIDPSQIEPTRELSPNGGEIEAMIQARHVTYENQLATLQTTIQERSTTYERQIAEMNNQLVIYQAAIEQAQQDIQTLNEQVTQLDQTLKNREAIYQAEFDRAVQPLIEHRNQLAAQLEAARLALSEANARLGR